MSRSLVQSLAMGAVAVATIGSAQTPSSGAGAPPALPDSRFQSRGVKVIQPDGSSTVTTTSTKTETKTLPGPANATKTTITTKTAVTTTPLPKPVAAGGSAATVAPSAAGAAVAPAWTMQAADQPVATQVTTTTTIAPQAAPATSTVIATTPPPPAPPPVQSAIKPCARPFQRPDLRLDGAAAFDRALAALLRRGRPVIVDLAVPYPKRADAPAALKPWLDAVGGSGGAVKGVPYCAAARGAFGGWLAKLFAPDPARIYRAARSYDAFLQTDSLDDIVTQVEFRPRAAR